MSKTKKANSIFGIILFIIGAFAMFYMAWQMQQMNKPEPEPTKYTPEAHSENNALPITPNAKSEAANIRTSHPKGL